MHPYHRLDQAILFSERAHRGQMRKGTDNPYFSHVVAVSMIVLSHGHGVDDAIVALLHDVLEDTPVDRDEIEEAFGPEITRAVSDLSEPDKKMRWEERKRVYCEQVRVASDLALPTCAADKIHNLRSILWDLDQARVEDRPTTDVWRRFRRPPHTMAAYHRAVELALRERGFRGSLMDELERALQRFAAAVGADPGEHRF